MPLLGALVLLVQLSFAYHALKTRHRSVSVFAREHYRDAQRDWLKLARETMQA